MIAVILTRSSSYRTRTWTEYTSGMPPGNLWKWCRPLAQRRTVNYIALEETLPSSIGELGEVANARIADAREGFKVDVQIQKLLDDTSLYDVRFVREKWGWQCQSDFEHLIDEFVTILCGNLAR